MCVCVCCRRCPGCVFPSKPCKTDGIPQKWFPHKGKNNVTHTHTHTNPLPRQPNSNIKPSERLYDFHTVEAVVLGWWWGRVPCLHQWILTFISASHYQHGLSEESAAPTPSTHTPPPTPRPLLQPRHKSLTTDSINFSRSEFLWTTVVPQGAIFCLGLSARPEMSLACYNSHGERNSPIHLWWSAASRS